MEFCPHCMRPASGDTCPNCGGRMDWTAQAGQLPLGSLLRGSDGHTYQVGAAKGQGGFGITYAAMDLTTAQRVAIKEYYPTRCAMRTQLHQVIPLTGQDHTYKGGMKSFLEEAMMLSAVGALPSVVTVKDYFEANGTAYLVMEYVDGVPLHQVVSKQGKMPAAELLPKLPPLLEDLDTLHRAGVIHRDISPDNLILTPEGTLKLLDFGSARSVQDGKSMTVLLKPGFSPVEQYQSRGQGPHTDVYALAGTIYYCLTGTLPPSAIDRLDSDGLQPPNSLGAGLTREQEEALLWGLTVQPKSRPASMEVFAKRLFPEKKPTLHTIIEEKKAPVQPKENPVPKVLEGVKKNKKAVVIGAAALAVILVVIILVAALSGGSADRPEPSAAVSQPPVSAPPATPTPEPTPSVPAEPVYGTTDDGYEYMITADRSECYLTGYTGEEEYLHTPDEVGGVPVTAIAENAFADNTVMESIWLPVKLVRMEKGAFKGCTNLRDIYVYSDVRASASAFSGCTRLRCVVRSTTDVSVANLGLPMDCKVYHRGMDTGLGGLNYVVVEGDGCIYAVTEDDNVVLMSVAVNCAEVSIPNQVSWVYSGALDGVNESVVLYMPADLLFPRELVYSADWQMQEEQKQFTIAYNWMMTCMLCDDIAGRRDVDMTTSRELVEAATLRAAELAQSYDANRPDGSNWSTVLDDCGVDWEYASAWRFRLDGLDNDAVLEKLEKIAANYAEPEPDNDNKYYTDFGIGFYYDEGADTLYILCFAVE